jgi:hypothetical protein
MKRPSNGKACVFQLSLPGCHRFPSHVARQHGVTQKNARHAITTSPECFARPVTILILPVTPFIRDHRVASSRSSPISFREALADVFFPSARDSFVLAVSPMPLDCGVVGFSLSLRSQEVPLSGHVAAIVFGYSRAIQWSMRQSPDQNRTVY